MDTEAYPLPAWAEITIHDRKGVRAFFDALIAAGINFHPDTEGHDYEPPLSHPHTYDRQMQRCFDLAEGAMIPFDVYEVAVEAIGPVKIRGER